MTFAVIRRAGSGLERSKLTVVVGFEDEDAARLYAGRYENHRLLRRGAEFSHGEPFFCEVVELDGTLQERGVPRSEFDEAVEDMRAKQAEAERQRIADQQAKHAAFLEEQRQSEISALAETKRREHEAELQKKFLAEAEAEIDKARKKAAK